MTACPEACSTPLNNGSQLPTMFPASASTVVIRTLKTMQIRLFIKTTTQAIELVAQPIKLNIGRNFERISRIGYGTRNINPGAFWSIGLLQRKAAPVPVKGHEALFPNQVQERPDSARHAVAQRRAKDNVVAGKLILMDLNGQYVVARDEICDERSGNDEHVRASGVASASIGSGRIGHACIGNCSRSGSHSQPSHFHSVQIEDGAIVNEIAKRQSGSGWVSIKREMRPEIISRSDTGACW